MKAALASGVAMLLMVAAAPVSAASTFHLIGGGTATISQVAFNVTVEGGGAASGSFNCLMAGRSAFVLPAFGLAHLMKVQAQPTIATMNANGSVVKFSGPGFLIMDGKNTQSVLVNVWADVANQQFQLTVVGVGTMPIENMLTGRFRLR